MKNRSSKALISRSCSRLSVIVAPIISVFLVACASNPTNEGMQKQAAERGINGVVFADSLPNVEVSSLINARLFPQLRIGDKAKVTVFGYEDLTGDYIVNRDGSVTFPLIGRKDILGLDALDLQKMLTDAFQDGFIKNPSITVEVENALLGGIVVDGAVGSPKVINLEDPITLSEAIALAGGVTEDADRDSVMIVRQVGAEKFIQTVDIDDLRSLGLKEPILVPNDFVFVQSDKTRQRYKDFLTLIPALNLAAIVLTRR